MEAQSQAQSAKGPKQRAQLGFVLSHEQFPAPRLIELGVAAEQAGFDLISTSDHFQPWQDNEGHAGLAWVTLAALGQRTSRLVMGTAVTCPTYRYRPAIVAQAFASLGVLYPGRVFLGVGTGEALNEVPAGGGWGDYDERAARLAEAVQVIRQLWMGDIVNHRGQYYQVENAKLYDVPPTPVPLYIAAAGPNSMRLAGQHGDGLITDPESAVKPELRQAFAEGARAADKDATTMPILVEHWVVVGDKQEAAKGAALWQFNPKAWDSYVNDPDPRDIQRRAQQEVPIDQVVSKWVVSTDPQVHIDALQKLVDGGINHIVVHSAQENQQHVIDFYSRQVLPRVRR